MHKGEESRSRWNRCVPYQDPDSAGLAEMLAQFGAELRRCRHRSGLSQDRLASLSGVSQSSISRLERGRAPYAGLHLILRLSDAMAPRMPLAFCPHEHACLWERLDANGDPLRRQAADDAPWQRLQAADDASWQRLQAAIESEPG